MRVHKKNCRCAGCCQETAAKIRRTARDPVHCAKMSVMFTKLRKDPAYRIRQSIALKNSKAAAKARKIKNKDPRYLKRLSESRKLAYKEGRRVPSGCTAPGYVSSRVSSFEKKLILALKNNAIHFQSQFAVPGTHYTADFYLPGVNLIVEVDLHPSHRTDKKRIAHDRRRAKRIKALGYRQLHLRRKSFRRGMVFCINRIIKAGN